MKKYAKGMKLLLAVSLFTFLCFGDASSTDAIADIAGTPAIPEPEDGIVPLAAVPINDDLETAKNALESMKNLVEIFNSDLFKGVNMVADVISKALSFVVSIISLILGLLGEESAEMKFLRKEFAEVNAKLDKISLQVMDVKDLIEWTTTRQIFSQYESNIKANYVRYREYLIADKKDREWRRKEFIKFYDKEDSALKLYHAIVEDYVVGSNLAAAAVQYTKNHQRKVMNFLLDMSNLIFRGAQMDIAYQRLVNCDSAGRITEFDWKIRMEKLITMMKKVDTQVRDVWHTQMKQDVERTVLEKKGLSHQDFSKYLYEFLADKYHWRRWFSLAYNELHGFQVHAFSNCDGTHHFRTHGRNMAVSSADPKSSRFNPVEANRLLPLVEMAVDWREGSLVLVEEINRRIGNDCRDAAFRGAINYHGANVWWYAGDKDTTSRSLSYKVLMFPGFNIAYRTVFLFG